MIIRLSEKLAKKTKETKLVSLPADHNPLADWTVRLFAAGRTQYILSCNTASLYAAVFYGKGVNDANQLLHRMMDTLRDVMEHDGLGEAYEREIAPLGASFRLAKGLNRSVTGSMNDLVSMATWHLTKYDESPFQVSFLLNETPMSYLKYCNPLAAFRFLVSESPRGVER